MKNQLRKVFSPILNCFETGEKTDDYKQSHRIILVVVAALFLLLSLLSLLAAMSTTQAFAFLPFVVFLCVGGVCLLVGILETDQAVAKIWGR